MTSQVKNLTGMRFGKLLVIALNPVRSPTGKYRWDCLCDCGNTTTVLRNNLRLKKGTFSCGCHRAKIAKRMSDSNITHGMTGTPTYKTWRNIHDRCENKNHMSYPWYGGKGIKVCARWGVFENFLVDMGERPAGLTIERNDSNQDYAPDNCRWATTKEQARNRSNNIMINGVCSVDHSIRLGGNINTVAERIRNGWSPERAISQPIQKNKHHGNN